ncbi:WbuC family cupin fold metalloprotein [Rhodohalobacter sp. 614A]|uniref:WbuC family cupin fold metalloprotein n=1 Tax=Rhodohalobacter sp. 614A TaxID=2908649 RepID=UPI001F2B2899|nr:WbuC family cupin fold metalloprotein [Rhodohalobacter sp. 614A]
MSKLAFDNVSGDLFELTEGMIKEGIQASRESDRKRIILPIHRKQDAEVQRMINFLQPGTYIRPHKHPLAHASESLILINGSIRFFTFDENGTVLSKNEISSKPVPGVLDIEPRVWHSFIVLEDDTILFECKKGPYNAQTDKTFAEWSPEEGSVEAQNWIESL